MHIAHNGLIVPLHTSHQEPDEQPNDPPDGTGPAKVVGQQKDGSTQHRASCLLVNVAVLMTADASMVHKMHEQVHKKAQQHAQVAN